MTKCTEKNNCRENKADNTRQDRVEEASPRPPTLLEKEHKLLQRALQDQLGLPIKWQREQTALSEIIRQHYVNIEFFKSCPEGESVFGQLLAREKYDLAELIMHPATSPSSRARIR